MEIGRIANLDIDQFVSSQWMKVHEAHSTTSDPAVRYPDINPNYTIIPSLRRTKIEPGDTMVIDLFFSGYGQPEINRLTAFASIDSIIEKKNEPIRTVPNVSGIIEDNKAISLVRGPPSRTLGLTDEKSFNGFPFTTPIPPAVFIDEPGPPNVSVDFTSYSYPSIVGETFMQDGAPLRIEIDTKDAAWYSTNWYSGEYSVQITFLYGDNQDFNIIKEKVIFEVQSRLEKFWWLTAIIAMFAVLSFIFRFIVLPLTSYIF